MWKNKYSSAWSVQKPKANLCQERRAAESKWFQTNQSLKWKDKNLSSSDKLGACLLICLFRPSEFNNTFTEWRALFLRKGY